MKRIGYDQISFDKDVKIEETDSEIIIRDVVIAREIVQPYDIDGEKKLAYKPGDELKDAAWTAEGMRITMDQHPMTVIIDRVDLIHGRMADIRFVKNLKDAKTKRPMARGVLSDLHFFKKQISAQKQEDIKNVKHRDVSIGFFYDADETPGKWNGDAYDFIQRNICIDHLAGPIPSGRCPMPYCGIGADSIPLRIVGLDPWEETEESIRSGHKDPANYEGMKTITITEGIKAVVGCPKGNYENGKCQVGMEVQSYIFSKEKFTMAQAKAWFKEHKGDEIMRDTILAYFNKADSLRTKVEKYINIIDAVSGDMTLEEIETKIQELRDARKALRDKIEKLYDTMYKPTKEEKEAREEIDDLWTQITDIDLELGAYMEAKVSKIAGDKGEVKPAGSKPADEAAKTNKERLMAEFDLAEDFVDKLIATFGESAYTLLPPLYKDEDKICGTCGNWVPCETCEEENMGTCSITEKEWPSDHECTSGNWKAKGDDAGSGVEGKGSEDKEKDAKSKTPVEETESLLSDPDLYDNA